VRTCRFPKVSICSFCHPTHPNCNPVNGSGRCPMKASPHAGLRLLTPLKRHKSNAAKSCSNNATSFTITRAFTGGLPTPQSTCDSKDLISHDQCIQLILTHSDPLDHQHREDSFHLLTVCLSTGHQDGIIYSLQLEHTNTHHEQRPSFPLFIHQICCSLFLKFRGLLLFIPLSVRKCDIHSSCHLGSVPKQWSTH
jgi:hypothetical protein